MRKLLFFSILFLGSLHIFSMPGLCEELYSEGKQGDISYVGGGVGITERTEMETMAENFNLKIIFAMASGEYLAKIPVTIRDNKSGEILHLIVNGPWLFVKLPEGTCTILAHYKDKAMEQTVRVNENLKTIWFHWEIE